MENNGALLVGLSYELTAYLKEHPEQLPKGVQKDDLWIICSQYVIDNIENYKFSHYKDKFLWRVKFKNSKFPEYEYLYFITYQAMYNKGAGIVEATLVNEKLDYMSPSLN